MALGEARETLAIIEVAEATGYVSCVAPSMQERLDHIIGTPVNLVR